MSGIYVAKEGFATADARGETVRVAPGDTVEEGHWLLDRAPDSFKPLEVTHPVVRPPAKSKPQK